MDEPRLRETWGGVFYHPDFVRAARQAHGLDGNSFYISRDGDRVGAINFLFRKRLGITSATPPLLFQYYGPLYFEPEAPRSGPGEWDDVLSSACDYVHFRLPPRMTPSGLGMSLPWEIRPLVTPVIDNQAFARWGNDFKDDVKNKIRKAAREKVIVGRADRLPTVLWTGAYERKGLKPPVEPAKVEGWCDSLISLGLLRIYVARIADTAVAFRAQLLYGSFAYDWLAGSNPHYHASGANQVLMSEIGQELASMGIKTWDLVGAEVKPIADFKFSFGAKAVEYSLAYRAFGFKGRIFESMRDLRHGG